MRWFWIDCFKEFVRGRHARAVKAVTLAEEHLHDHFPGVGIMPATLVLEGMAQTAGILIADALDYRRQVVLAKVGSMRFAFEAVPGDTIEYFAEVVDFSELGSVVRVTSRVDGREHGEAELYYGHIEKGPTVPQLFRRDEMLRWLDALRVSVVSVDEHGKPLSRDTGPQ